MPHLLDDPFPFPEPRPRPRFPSIPPFPVPPVFPDPARPVLPPLTALPLPQPGGVPSRLPLPRGPGEVFQFPAPGANEPFGGRVIRIGRIIRGIGLGGIIIIATEILIDQLEKRQLRKIGEIIERQDAEIAQRQLERLEERRRAKELEIEPGKFPLPQIGGAEIPPPKPVTAPRIPTPIRRPRPVTLPTFPDIFPTFPAPRPLEIPSPRPIVLPKLPPLTFPGQMPQPGVRTIPSPFPFPGTQPGLQPVFFPIGSPAADPRTQPIGDPLPPRLTPVQPPGLPSGLIDVGPQPGPQPQQATQQCQVVKRRRRRKGKCREGFFVERPGETQFTTWREGECDTGLGLGTVLEIIK